METGWSSAPAIHFADCFRGALPALLVHLLTTDVIDAVIQTAAVPDLVIGNATVIAEGVTPCAAHARFHCADSRSGLPPQSSHTISPAR